MQRTWLWGSETGRPALLLDFAPPGAPLEPRPRRRDGARGVARVLSERDAAAGAGGRARPAGSRPGRFGAGGVSAPRSGPPPPPSPRTPGSRTGRSRCRPPSRPARVDRVRPPTARCPWAAPRPPAGACSRCPAGARCRLRALERRAPDAPGGRATAPRTVGAVSGWDELVAVALIGTDRRPVEAGAPPGSPAGLEAALAGRGAGGSAAGVGGGVDRRAPGGCAGGRGDDRRARRRRTRARSARPPRARGCGPAARRRLPGARAGMARRARRRRAAAAARGRPGLLEHAAGPTRRCTSRWRRPPARSAAGWPTASRAGRSCAATGAADWADGTRPQRRALLARLRRAIRTAARELLASTFADEPWEDRDAFVDVLADGLSDADEPLLEGVLDDPRKPVSDAAAALLARLPRSRYAARAAAWVGPLLRVEGGRHRRRAARAAGRRRPPRRVSVRAACAPSASYGAARRRRRSPPGPSICSPCRGRRRSRPRAARGLVRRRRAAGDAEWARALWPLTATPSCSPCCRATRARRSRRPPTIRSPPRWSCAGRGAPTLSRTVIDGGRRGDARPAGTSAFAGYRLDPSLETEVEALRDLGGRDIWSLCDTLVARAAMLRELA